MSIFQGVSMQNFDQSAESNRDELAHAIKGYQGYSSPKHRIKTDQIFRNFLLKRLNTINKRLPQFEKLIQNLANQDNSDPLKRIHSTVKMLINSLESPCSSDQAFFSKKDISPEKLSQLYVYDLQLKDQVEILGDELEQHDVDAEDQEITDILNHLYDLTDGLNQALTEREFLIMGE